MVLDYEILRLIWWVLIGVLLIGFALTDGYDMGVGTLLPFNGRNDAERQAMIDAIAPHWDGNQVWFILAGGAIFAAWPPVYAAAFSGFYFALLLVLLALIFRPPAFEYRTNLAQPAWRKSWDWALFAGSTIPALVFGVAFGNLLLGVPFHLDDTLRSFYTGSFFALFHPFALLAGLVSLTMLTAHGATYLMLRMEGELYERARTAARWFALVAMIAFALAGLWLAFGIDGYRVVSAAAADAPSNPLAKVVEKTAGAWLSNYRAHPWTLIAPLMGLGGALGVVGFAARRQGGAAFGASCLMVAGIIATAGLTLFPFIMPSSTVPSSSLTLWDATASRGTLAIMFWVAVVFLPIVLAYTAWTWWVMRGRIRIEAGRPRIGY